MGPKPVPALAFQELMAIAIEKGCRDLLLATVRDSTDAEGLRRLAANVADWDGLIDLALQHRVVPTLAARIAEMGRSVPSRALIRIQSEYDRVVLHNFASAAELIAVLQGFDREGIQAMPFKGVVLAAFAYGDLLKRPGGDLDLLVRAEDIARASTMVLQRGYELRPPVAFDGGSELPEPNEHTFIRPTDGMVLELRWKLDLMWNRYGRTLGMNWVWPHRRTVMLSGAEIQNIDPERQLLLLCMHGSKHSWSRLIWVCDVGKLIGSSPDLDWEQALKEGRRQGLGRTLKLGVLLAVRMTGATVPPWVLAQFAADQTAWRLADHFANSLLETPGEGPPGRVPYWARLVDFLDRSKQLLNLLRPNQRDQAVVGLPQWLRPLYYLLRPLRLLWDRSAR